MTPRNVYPFEFSHGGGPFVATAKSPLYEGTAVQIMSTFRFVVLPTEVVKNYF